jgi:hypothetical protein
MKPYTEIDVGDNNFIREFKSDISSDELEWHLDKEDRIIEVVNNDGGWEFQLDNSLPILLKETIFIPRETYHRVIKGKGALTLRIQKLYGSENNNYTGKN